VVKKESLVGTIAWQAYDLDEASTKLLHKGPKSDEAISTVAALRFIPGARALCTEPEKRSSL